MLMRDREEAQLRYDKIAVDRLTLTVTLNMTYVNFILLIQ